MVAGSVRSASMRSPASVTAQRLDTMFTPKQIWLCPSVGNHVLFWVPQFVSARAAFCPTPAPRRQEPRFRRAFSANQDGGNAS